MSLEDVIVPESEKVLKKEKCNKNVQNPQRWVYVNRTQEPIERAPSEQSWNNVSHKIHGAVFYYNTSY